MGEWGGKGGCKLCCDLSPLRPPFSLLSFLCSFSPFLHPPPCSEGITSMTVAKKRAFFDDRWTQNRIVTSMDWSGHVSRVLVSLECLPGILSSQMSTSLLLLLFPLFLPLLLLFLLLWVFINFPPLPPVPYYKTILNNLTLQCAYMEICVFTRG